MLALINTLDLFRSTVTALPRLLVLPLTLIRSLRKFSYKSVRQAKTMNETRLSNNTRKERERKTRIRERQIGAKQCDGSHWLSRDLHLVVGHLVFCLHESLQPSSVYTQVDFYDCKSRMSNNNNNNCVCILLWSTYEFESIHDSILNWFRAIDRKFELDLLLLEKLSFRDIRHLGVSFCFLQ